MLNFRESRVGEVRRNLIRRSSNNRLSQKFSKKLALMLVDTEPEEAVRCAIVSPRLPD